MSLGIFFSLWYWELIFYRHMVELSVFQLINYTSPTPLLNQPNHPYTPTTHTTHAHTQHIPHIHTSAPPNQSCHIIDICNKPLHIIIGIYNEPLTIPPRENTIMTIPCVFPCSRNYLFEPSSQHFFKQPVHFTPVIINAENGNLPVYFINHNDQEVIIPKHSYVGSMEKVQESD